MSDDKEREHCIEVAREIKNACDLVEHDRVVEVDFSCLPEILMRERAAARRELLNECCETDDCAASHARKAGETIAQLRAKDAIDHERYTVAMIALGFARGLIMRMRTPEFDEDIKWLDARINRVFDLNDQAQPPPPTDRD